MRPPQPSEHLTAAVQQESRHAADRGDMNPALVTVTLSAAIAATTVAVRARVTPRRVPVLVPVQVRREDSWHPHVSTGCGR